MRQLLLFLLAIYVISCNNDIERTSTPPSKDSLFINQYLTMTDSITEISIHYYPSFANYSLLKLNRLNQTGSFMVDSSNNFGYRGLDTIQFSLNEMESNTEIDKLWNASFLHSLRMDTSMLGYTDGMPVEIYFQNWDKQDTVYLGNVFPKRVKIVLLDQFEYLFKKASSKSMKAYLRELKRYL